MDSFKLDLANGWTLRGISNIPPSSKSPVEYRPLIIGLHGSTYDCRYFDGDARHTALIASNAFGVPFVAIDRPGSGETTSPLPLLSDSNFPQQTGNWLHNLIIPALWSEFGVPNGCNCVVLLCHSLGAMGGIVTGAIHAQDDNPSYLLGGIIASGIGDQLLPEMRENPIREPNVPPHHVRFPLEAKDALMFRPGTVHEDILKHTERLDTPAPFVELESLRDLWVPTWKHGWARHVEAPVMFGMSEQDCFFVGTEEHVKVCVEAFGSSSRVDGSLIKGAPHCMELSFWSQGWYARCFGFAMECSASLGHSLGHGAR
ncbi:uncharacterized protein TRIREDRAFT_103772 [Trichoderma reesei QM6a]|jgi:pimeloyl-ACP methyl ester carboxylesterase|uniref:Predicted protein n=2 Tax=Hypocrea jecorina TaxID=51453 RepID=G0R9S9_HYPJQ|nr:uncharacterized protein TRIREDRAFT_103772 [Trichoderma reesei QM6a]EGR52009.1 predicted protein [Trichoderma reesei QM6a]ETS05349.1 hypothetical protein M419DRAFT_70450 [Trichoderma reesei RUT C-30]